VQDLLYGRPHGRKLAEILGAGAHHRILGRQPDAKEDIAPQYLTVDDPAG
jgi:hypothetical protein